MKLTRRGLFSLVAGLPLVKKLAGKSAPKQMQREGTLCTRALSVLDEAYQRTGLETSWLLWIGPPSFRAAVYTEGIATMQWCKSQPARPDRLTRLTCSDFRLGGVRAVVSPYLVDGTAYLCRTSPRTNQMGDWFAFEEVLGTLHYEVPPGYGPFPQSQPRCVPEGHQ